MLRVAKMYIRTFNISFMVRRFSGIILAAVMQDRFTFQHLVRLFQNRTPIIKGPITGINGSFADCYCDMSRVELLLYVVEIVFTCNKEVIEDLMVITS